MLSVYEQYTEELRSKFGYLATWIPNTQLRLGDIGRLKRDRFEYYTNLNELGIPFTVRKSGELSSIEYSSKGGVEINFKASGDAPAVGQYLAQMDAGLSVLFKRENAIMFIGQDCRTDQIENIEKLGQEILKRYDCEQWDKDYVIITEIVNTGSSTIIISNSSNGRADFKVSAKTGGGHMPSLADLSGNVTVTNSCGIDTKIIAAGNLTPLFRASGIRRKFLGGREFETRSGEPHQRNMADVNEMVFSDLEYEDFEK